VCVCACVFLYVYQFFSVLCLCLHLFLSVSLSPYLSVSFSLSLSLSVSLSFCLIMSLSLCLCLSLFRFLSLLIVLVLVISVLEYRLSGVQNVFPFPGFKLAMFFCKSTSQSWTSVFADTNWHKLKVESRAILKRTICQHGPKRRRGSHHNHLKYLCTSLRPNNASFHNLLFFILCHGLYTLV
jgi:hypothetical protein